MNIEIKATKENFIHVYKQEKAAALKWVTGTASKELIDLVWNELIPPRSNILELGCGVGTEAVFLAVRGMQVTAVDISPESLDIGRKLANVYDVHVNFQEENVLNLPFAADSFDVICDRGCYHCFSGNDRETYASQIIRVCKTGGLFVLRCFSDSGQDYSWVKKSTSNDLIQLFSRDMNLEHLERISSLPKADGTRSEAWYSIWKKK